MAIIKLAEKRVVWAVIVSDDRFNSGEMLVMSVRQLIEDAAIDRVFVADNAAAVPVSKTLEEYNGHRKLSIVRWDQSGSTGSRLNQIIVQFQKSNATPYILFVEPGTVLVNQAAEKLRAMIDINNEEISAAYGDLVCDNLFLLHQLSFNKERFLQQNTITLPVMVNSDALFEMQVTNPSHPLIDTNMDIHWLYDLLIRLTSNSMVLHTPNVIATKHLIRLDPNLEQTHFQYLQKKYGQQQIQTQ